MEWIAAHGLEGPMNGDKPPAAHAAAAPVGDGQATSDDEDSSSEDPTLEVEDEPPGGLWWIAPSEGLAATTAFEVWVSGRALILVVTSSLATVARHL